MMSKELMATFKVTKTYLVTAFGHSDDECYDNLEYVKEDEYEFVDEQVELIDTQYASF
jgi:hypothetical protein